MAFTPAFEKLRSDKRTSTAMPGDEVVYCVEGRPQTEAALDPESGLAAGGGVLGVSAVPVDDNVPASQVKLAGGASENCPIVAMGPVGATGAFGDRLGNLEHNPQDFLGLCVEGKRLALLVVILPLVVIGARGGGWRIIHGF